MKLAKDVQVEQLAGRKDLQGQGVTKTMLDRLSAKQVNRLWCIAYGQQRFGRPCKPPLAKRDLSRFAPQIKAGNITNWRPSRPARKFPAQLVLLF